MVSHETALALWGLSDLMPERTHLSVPKGFRKRTPAGVVLHEADFAEGDVEMLNDLPVTTPLRTLRDVAEDQRVSPEHLETAAREAVERGLVRRKKLRQMLSLIKNGDRRRIVEEAIGDPSGMPA